MLQTTLTIVDIYADEGLIKNRDVTPIIQNLHRMLHKNQPGSQRAVNQEMASTAGLLGMSAGNLRDYLVEY
jgi:hypothetical protein